MSGISETMLNSIEACAANAPTSITDDKIIDLINEIRRQRELIAGLTPLAKLGVEAVEECAWQGYNFDGGDIQESATKIGAIQEAAGGYDPDLHVESDLCEPGDQWFEFPPVVLAAKRWMEEAA